jgi:hypothetical protein
VVACLVVMHPLGAPVPQGGLCFKGGGSLPGSDAKNITNDAWEIIVTSFEDGGHNEEDEGVTQNVTRVTLFQWHLEQVVEWNSVCYNYSER